MSKPITTVVSISRQGIYDAKRRVWYWADWMRTRRGEKVVVFGDIFSDNTVHVYIANNEEYLGTATTRGPVRVFSSSPTAKSVLNAVKTERIIARFKRENAEVAA